MILWIREQLSSNELDKINIQKTELASEEALVNVIEHGYKGFSGEIAIEIVPLPLQIEIIFEIGGLPLILSSKRLVLIHWLPWKSGKLEGLGYYLCVNMLTIFDICAMEISISSL